jgi:uncharacterized protein (TIGR03083 family)
MPSVDDLLSTRDLCVEFLRTVADRDWSSSIPGLDLNIAETCAHMAQVNVWYSIDLASRGVDLQSVNPEIKADTDPDDLISTLHAVAELLAAAVAATPADVRGFHPFGETDAAGFAAMACDEMLIHTHDISRGLGVEFEPPAHLASEVLARLFPEVDGREDPWTLLQWANGRIALPGREQRSKWQWRCAPIDE